MRYKLVAVPAGTKFPDPCWASASRATVERRIASGQMVLIGDHTPALHDNWAAVVDVEPATNDYGKVAL